MCPKSVFSPVRAVFRGGSAHHFGLGVGEKQPTPLLFTGFGLGVRFWFKGQILVVPGRRAGVRPGFCGVSPFFFPLFTLVEHVVLTGSPAALPPCRPAALPPCRPAALQPCSPAALQPCNPAALPPCRPAALQPCSPAALQPCSPAALQPCRPAALPPCSPAALQPCSPATLPPCRPAALPPCRPAALPPCRPCCFNFLALSSIEFNASRFTVALTSWPFQSTKKGPTLSNGALRFSSLLNGNWQLVRGVASPFAPMYPVYGKRANKRVISVYSITVTGHELPTTFSYIYNPGRQLIRIN
jgi:hypothetical protein